VARAAAVGIDCATTQPLAATPSLRLLPVSGEHRTDTTGHWHIESLQTIILPPGLGLAPITTTSNKATRTLYSVGQYALITEIRTDTRHQIDVHFDLHDPAMVNSPAYPRLLNALLERLLAVDLLDDTWAITRQQQASRIAPLLRDPGKAPDISPGAARRTSLVDPLILLGLALLTVDLIRERRLPKGANP
jgi:hypothetical protein